MISQETYENMMGDMNLEIMDGAGFWFPMSRGGQATYGIEMEEIRKSTAAHNKSLLETMHTGREGYTGWMGYGGSVFNWHSELEIGFGYVPFNYIDIDLSNKRGAKI